MTQSYSAQTELGHLSAGISAGATSITLVSGEGAQFDTDLPYDIMIGGDGGETVSLTAIATDTPAANTLLYDYVHGTPSTASTLSIDISCVVLQRWR